MRAVAGVALAVAMLALNGRVLAAPAPPPPPPPADVVRAAWQAVRDHYFDPGFGGAAWDEALLERYLARAAAPDADGYRLAAEMVASLGDPLTVVVEPSARATQVPSSPRVQVVGIGVRLSTGPEEYPLVRQVLPGGPASRGGVWAGALVVAVDGRPTQGRPLDEVAAEIRGAAGTRVRLQLERADGSRVSVELTRQAVAWEPRAVSRVLDGNVGYLHLPHFHPGMETAALAELRKLYRTRALILDLRDSSGAGAYATLSHIAGLLTDQPLGLWVTRQGLVGLPSQRATASANPLVPAPTSADRYEQPVAILIDEVSAFGLMAFGLRQSGRAVLVGRPTRPGAGELAATLELPGGGLVQVTTGRFYSARGDPLVGPVVPDVTVPLDRHYLRAWEAGQDPDVAQAIALLRRRGAL
ncbi:S41 family peptidase [Geochorda subterranea]|uniref:S41 family peptidase n=1 Tax=Geochorda subterranea TaxID=3109564 RepID=A0ABZ1BR03_9FIRM|nr:S41 family peptidase [Limnochorda sp. LNt]WRP14881.1 S41 family peptidase [Limnochorda sp. LNt]